MGKEMAQNSLGLLQRFVICFFAFFFVLFSCFFERNIEFFFFFLVKRVTIFL